MGRKAERRAGWKAERRAGWIIDCRPKTLGSSPLNNKAAIHSAAAEMCHPRPSARAVSHTAKFLVACDFLSDPTLPNSTNLLPG